MTGLLSELGKKLADRWLSAVLLPGLLYTAVAIGAWIAGHRHAANPAHLTAGIDKIVHHLATRPAGTALAIAAVLLSATAAALTAQGAAGLVQRGLVARRPQRWIDRRARDTGHTAGLERYRPHRASAVGDRFYLLGQRIDVQYGLDITLVWPRLWLLLPDQARATIQTAYAAYRAALTTCGWALLYTALGIIWWPGLLIGAATITIGYRRAVTAATVLTDLIEAATDIHQQQLATALGITVHDGRITRADGLQINNILNKRATTKDPTRRPQPERTPPGVVPKSVVSGTTSPHHPKTRPGN